MSPLGDGDQAGCRRPAVLQLEIHPFVGPVQQMLSFCSTQGIAVQGHTMLARGMFLGFPPLVRMAARYDVSPAVLMLRWAQQLGVGVLFHSSDATHLDEVVGGVHRAAPIAARDMAEISGYHCVLARRFFTEAVPVLPASSLDAITETKAYVEAVAERLSCDRAALAKGASLSETALAVPHQCNREILFDPLAKQIAARLFPDVGGSMARQQRYRDLLRKLRAALMAAKATTPKCCALGKSTAVPSPIVVAGRPVSSAVAYPQAMPVEVAPLAELRPFFDFLAAPDGWFEADEAGPLTFPRGTYFPDQRMDLCKQVVGPDHVGRLADALVAQAECDVAHPVRHFLLGNNVACDGDDPVAAAELARVAEHVSIETWYLAGNGIGPRAMAIIAQALVEAPEARALWLKRNPLGPAGARVLGRMLARHRGLELLDLHNTGLFDEGVAAMVEGSRDLSLRHLYLSANALTQEAIRALGTRLGERTLVSLYLSMNRLGAKGLAALVELLERGLLDGLERLDLGAVGLEADDLRGLGRVLARRCPRLRFLDLGTYRATRDLGEEANRLGGAVGSLRQIMRHPRLEVLGLAAVGLNDDEKGELLDGLRPGQWLLGVSNGGKGQDDKRLQRVRQPLRVADIESVYRGRA